jgi:hypothetical protein
MSDSNADKTTGRTPWDVVAIMVSRLGPTTIVVIDFLAVTGFLFEKVINAEGDAQKRLVDKSLTRNYYHDFKALLFSSSRV